MQRKGTSTIHENGDVLQSFFLPLTGYIENLKSVVDCMIDRKQLWYIAWSCIRHWRPYNILQPKLLVSRELEEINLLDSCTQPYLLLAVKLSLNMHTLCNEM